MAIWTPTEIINDLDAWFLSTDRLIGTGVSQLTDNSNNSNNWVQATGSSQPSVNTSALNGIDSISCATDNTYLANTAFYTRAIAIVLKWGTVDGKYRHIFKNASVWHGDTTTSVFNSGYTLDKVYNGRCRVNGTELPNALALTKNTSAFEIVVLIPTERVEIEGTGWQTGFTDRNFNGEFTEIISFIPTIENILKIEGYLAHKYALNSNLPSTHAYNAAAPTKVVISTTKEVTFTIPANTVSENLTDFPVRIAINDSSGTSGENLEEVFDELPITVSDSTPWDKLILTDASRNKLFTEVEYYLPLSGDSVEIDRTLGDNYEQYNGTDPGSAFDGVINDDNATGSWYCYHSGGYQTSGYVGKDYGAGNEKVVNKIALMGYSSAPTNTPDVWTFQGSQNGTDWDTLKSVGSSEVSIPASSFVEVDIDNTEAYRYYRVNVSSVVSGTYCIIKELMFYENRRSKKAVLHTKVSIPDYTADTVITLNYNPTNTNNNSTGKHPVRSVIIDMADNWGDGSYLGLRSVKLLLGNWRYEFSSSELVGYDTSSAFDPIHAFKKDVSDTGASLTTNGWTSDSSSVTDQRIICVLPSTVDVTDIVINNYHHSGGLTTRGAKNIKVFTSTDVVTDTVYGNSITNSTLIYDGELPQHTASDAQDDNDIPLIGFIGEVGSIPAINAWDSSYVLVSHMAQDPSGTAPQLLDSTANTNNGTSVGTMLTEDLVQLPDGTWGIDFDGTDDGFLIADNSSLDGISTAFTFDVFFNSNDIESIENWLIAQDDNIDGRSFALGTRYSKLEFQVAGAAPIRNQSAALSNNVDYLFSVTGNSTDGLKGYIDGLQNGGTASWSSPTNVNADLSIAHRTYSGSESFFSGIEYEVRMSDVARSAAWIAATNSSLRDTLLVASINTETPLNEFGITIPANTFAENLINYPHKIVLNNNCGANSFNVHNLFAKLPYIPGSVHYPAAHNSTYVKASSRLTVYYEYNATNPALSKTGSYSGTAWISASTVTAAKLNVDYTTPFIATRFYLENHHTSGSENYYGVKDFILYGSNDAAAFANTTFANTDNLVELGTFTADKHIASDVEDPQYFEFANDTAYQYYFIRILNNYSGGTYVGIRHFEFQVKEELGWDKIQITDSNGDKLFAEVELYDPDNLKAVIHTKVDIPDYTADTVITLNYDPSNVIEAADNTSVQLTSESSNGYTDITDDSGNNLLVTINGAVTHSTDQSKFGNTSLKIATTSSDFLAISDNEVLDLTSGDWTIEFFIYFPTVGGTATNFMGHNVGSGSYDGWYLQVTAANALLFMSNSNTQICTGGTINSATWYHVCIESNSGTISMAIQGAVVDTEITTIQKPTTGIPLTIGRLGPGYSSYTKPFYMESFRITKGEAVYGGSNYSVPTADLAIPDQPRIGIIGSAAGQKVWNSDFTFVCHMAQDPSGTAPQLLDSTVYGADGTSEGTMLTEDLVQLPDGTWGIDFDGTDDSVNFGAHSQHDITDTLTVEYHFKPNTTLNASTGTVDLIGRQLAPSAADTWLFSISTSTGVLLMGSYGGNIQGTKNNWNANDEFCVAATYNATGTTGDLFVNGIEETLTVDNYDTMAGASSNILHINGESGYSRYGNTITYEARISKVVRSSNWIKASIKSLQDSVNEFSFNYPPPSAGSETINYINQIWGLADGTTAFVNQIYGIFETNVINQYWNFLTAAEKYYSMVWALHEVAVVNQYWSDAPITLKVIHQYWSNAQSPINIVHQIYNGLVENTVSVDQVYNILTEAINIINQRFTITGTEAVNFYNQYYNLNNFYLTENAIDQIWSLVYGKTFIANHNFSVVMNSVNIPVDMIQIDRDENRYTIDASIRIVDPSYFKLFEKKDKPIVITINSTEFHLVTRPKTTAIGKAGKTLTVACKSPACLLDANTTVTLQKEFRSEFAHVLFAELASIEGITVDWTIQQDNTIVTGTIPGGTFFANNETPLACMRKILECVGGAMLSQPDGTLKVVHREPTRVPDYATTSPGITLDDKVRFEAMTISEIDNPKYNVVNVSDQLTADTSYRLEEEDISSTEKYIRGFHTPWDSAEVELQTSGGSTIQIDYLGVRNVIWPPLEEDDELIVFQNGNASTSKPLYDRFESDWIEDNLGSITFSEDGTLQSEIDDYSLLRIRYYTRYHEWKVKSPTLADVQFKLVPKS